MNILILTAKDHIYGNVVLNHLARSGRLNADQVLVLEETSILPGRSWLAGILRYLKISGPHYVGVQICKQYLFKLRRSIDGFRHRQDSPYFPYAAHDGGDWHREEIAVLNTPAVVKRIHAYAPDMILSVFSRDIIPAAIFSIPRYGCLNIHPGWLPLYRGVSPTFWCLVNQDRHAGVTLHHVDAGIDTGAIIARQAVAVGPLISEHRLYMQCARIAASLLMNFLEHYESDCNTLPQTGHPPARGCYYSLPDKAAVARFNSQGYRFFHLQEFTRPEKFFRHPYY